MTTTETTPGVASENDAIPAPLLERLDALGDWLPDPLRDAFLDAARADARRETVAEAVAAVRAELDQAVSGPLDLDGVVVATGRLVALERLEALLSTPAVPAEVVTDALEVAERRLAVLGQGVVIREPLYATLVARWRRQGTVGLPPAALPQDLEAVAVFEELVVELQRWEETGTTWRKDKGVGSPLDSLGAAQGIARQAAELTERVAAYDEAAMDALRARRDAGLPHRT